MGTVQLYARCFVVVDGLVLKAVCNGAQHDEVVIQLLMQEPPCARTIWVPRHFSCFFSGTEVGDKPGMCVT